MSDWPEGAQMMTLETLDFYRPWCRGCGVKEGPCVFAGEHDPWVEDEDDIGFPFCLTCVDRLIEAQRDWSFDVFTAKHDDMKGGGPYEKVRSRVVVSRTEFPTYGLAAETAACIAMCIHGGMATDILWRI